MLGKGPKRYNISNKRKNDNLVFVKSEKTFYDKQPKKANNRNQNHIKKLKITQGVTKHENNKATVVQTQRHECGKISQVVPIIRLF